MKILSVNNQSQNNVNFGLYNRHLANSKKLVEYWSSRGFSDEAIQSAMVKLDSYKTKSETLPIIDFVLSLFSKEKPITGAKKFPAIDFEDIKTDRIIKCSYMENDIVKENVDIPSILYSFAKSSMKMPFNKTFKTQLEVPVYTSSGTTLEPKSPIKVVKEIIKNYKIFEKQLSAPNDYLAPAQSRIFGTMKVSLD